MSRRDRMWKYFLYKVKCAMTLYNHRCLKENNLKTTVDMKHGIESNRSSRLKREADSLNGRKWMILIRKRPTSSPGLFPLGKREKPWRRGWRTNRAPTGERSNGEFSVNKAIKASGKGRGGEPYLINHFFCIIFTFLSCYLLSSLLVYH